MSYQNAAVSGVAAGVPYVALPPGERGDGQVPAPLIIAWHLNDPPRSAAAMAAALPLAAVTAWRVYLDLPMHGRRQLPGGLEEFMALSPVIQLAEVIAANERRFGVSYPWSGASRAVAARLDFISRAGEIAARAPQPAILLITGASDDPAFPLQAQRLQAELRRRYSDPQRVGLTSIPGMKHAFAAEPGIEPAPQTAEAKLVDVAVTDWFCRYLR